jgi:hypothetical protein
MRLTLASIAFISGVSFSLASFAATVDSIQGSLAINRGKGFQRVTGPVQAKVGDSVMVSPGGSAQVSYPDGCAVNVTPGAVVTIGAQSPCAAGQEWTATEVLVVGSYIVGTNVAGYHMMNDNDNNNLVVGQGGSGGGSGGGGAGPSSP